MKIHEGLVVKHKMVPIKAIVDLHAYIYTYTHTYVYIYSLYKFFFKDLRKSKEQELQWLDI